jgi:hypothetical protein
MNDLTGQSEITEYNHRPSRREALPRGSITVHIERLALEGLRLGVGEERLLRIAMQEELGRLLAEGELPARLRSGGAVPSLAGVSPSTPERSDPGSTGRGSLLPRAISRKGPSGNPPGERGDKPGGAAALEITWWSDPADLGRQIARALYGGLQR